MFRVYFVSYYPDAPLAVGNRYDHPSDAEEVEGTFHVDRSWQWPSGDHDPKTFHLATWDRLVDAIEDDEPECGGADFRSRFRCRR
jgi:hypothetical protein